MATNTPTPLQTKDIYKDLSFNMSLHPLTRDVSSITNENAVRRSLKNIILTDKLERPMNPTFGCNVRRHLFELITPATVQIIKAEVINAIQNYEPRVYLNDVIVKGREDNNSISIEIVYTTQTNTIPERLTVILDRIR